jgi:hypothetical protein
MQITDLPDSEFLFRVRHLNAFVDLCRLLGEDEARVSTAMRAEIQFVRRHPGCPRGSAIAERVRTYMATQDLPFTVPGYECAVRALGIADLP